MPESLAFHPVAWLPDEWVKPVQDLRERSFVAGQAFAWIHRKNELDPDRMSNLPASVRTWLKTEGLAETITTQHEHLSSDGTRKLLVRFKDGLTAETVLIPSISDDADAASADTDDDDAAPEEQSVVKVTQCISTQVGCAMGCVFCASGAAGLKRHLGAHEIVAQVLHGRKSLPPGQRVSNVVFMGMGEPLHNYEATARALRLLCYAEGIGLSKRRVTVSTSGLIPEIDRLGKEFEGQVALAVSLHATSDESRSALMPINRRYPLAELMKALRRYPLPPRRRITIEYTLVAGQNDSAEEAHALIRLLGGIRSKVNLIPMNPIATSALGPPNHAHVLAFQRILTEAGLSCFIRRRRGDDVAAACGQLAVLGAKPKVKGHRENPQ